MGGGALFSLLIMGLLVAYPFSRILPRVGLNPWISLVAVIPIGAVVLLWVVAFRTWKD
ncbi:MAG: hypothetical protein HKO95_09335 [Rhodobacteraceae bacterium]|nr:hypothetical protein [Alphaproteobacteria bacterium]MBT8476524.1 hypothetical protein [Alphaproteobacteria bacterium]NNF71521.1 hypothetical protein [Paracoccaceae bacterium]NNK66928.1 hypothetical protein [Paracoccaceae bacterium]